MKEFFESNAYRQINSKVTGIGAAIVIMGCLFKLQHYPYAGTMLGIGLSVEALIFILSAFEPLYEELLGPAPLDTHRELLLV